jgi:hypothetical protein
LYFVYAAESGQPSRQCKTSLREPVMSAMAYSALKIMRRRAAGIPRPAPPTRGRIPAAW